MPAAYMNTRMPITTQGWFGGGADLKLTLLGTPRRSRTRPISTPAKTPHAIGSIRHYYPRSKEWPDRDFLLPHRGEPRAWAAFLRPS